MLLVYADTLVICIAKYKDYYSHVKSCHIRMSIYIYIYMYIYIYVYIDTLLGGFSIQNRRGQSQGNLNESPLRFVATEPSQTGRSLILQTN